MSSTLAAVGSGLTVVLGLLVAPVAAQCPPDSVQSGTVCMDQYEASVWYVPPADTNVTNTLIRRIRNGNVTLANLTSPAAVAAGVVQRGLTAVSGGNTVPECPLDGAGCVDVYAVSIPGVRPATGLNWAQAAAAARNSRKRLPSNQEWQVAALGTPPGGAGNPCPNADDATVALTGSRPACVSDVGAFDMVGNVYEWVADWVPGKTTCTAFPLFGEGLNCLAAVNPFNQFFDPSTVAIVRSGSGVFDVNGMRSPDYRENTLGFRAVR